MNTFELDKEYIAGTYKRFPLEITGGKGALVFGSDGREYIDLGSGIATNTFGFCDDGWREAVKEQIDSFGHTSNLYYTSPDARLAQMLCEKTGLKRVFFCNSGAEANEGAIKAARKYSFDKYGRGRNRIICLNNSFHGRTVTTLSATGQDVFHNWFFPFTEGFTFIDANDSAALDAELEKGDVCAVMAELIQGEGGVLPLDKSFVNHIAEVCADKDVLFVTDEVQTGNGRCGTLYAFQSFGVLPDIVSTAKGLASGLPLGAVMLGEKVKDTLGAGSHGSTFGGNPICCAGALYTLSRLDDGFLKGVKERGEYIRAVLKDCPGVVSIDGMGLMLGIKTVKPASEVVTDCLANGVLVLTAKDKVRLLPPLNIEYALLDKALGILKNVIE